MRNFLFFSLILLLIGCSDPSVEIIPGIYFWENDTRRLTPDNLAALDSLKIEKLYIKVFEVDRIGGVNLPQAKSSLVLSSPSLHKLEIIPCVYILNSVFIESSRSELDELADNVVQLSEKYVNEKLTPEFDARYQEIQIDCDWSEKSQGNYFYFLRKVKEISQKKISCTLRLYPYKFNERMGVPPCDRATLMCYNLLNPVKNPERNTILDVEEMGKYLDTKINYPIPLDVALPLYSWIQCYEGTRVKGIIHGPIEEYLPLFSHDKGLWYTSEHDTVVRDVYFRKGDRVKMERVSNHDLVKAIDLIKSSGVLKENAVFSYFHLSSQEINFYTYEKLNSNTARLSR